MIRRIILSLNLQSYLWLFLSITLSPYTFPIQCVEVPLKHLTYTKEDCHSDNSCCTHMTIPEDSLAEALLLFYSNISIDALVKTIQSRSAEDRFIENELEVKLFKYLNYQQHATRSWFDCILLAGSGSEATVTTYPHLTGLLNFINHIKQHNKTINTASAIYSLIQYSSDNPKHLLARKYSQLLLSPLSNNRQYSTENLRILINKAFYINKKYSDSEKKQETITKTKKKSTIISNFYNLNSSINITGAIALFWSQIKSAIGRKTQVHIPTRPTPCNPSDNTTHCNCPNNKFICPKSFKCIKAHNMCDDIKHCPGGEDEYNRYCQYWGKKLDNNTIQCITDKNFISKSKRCNGIPDCRDNSDEMNCFCNGLPSCDNGQCLKEFSSRCNGIIDCTDKSDENDCDIYTLPKELSSYCPAHSTITTCLKYLKNIWCKSISIDMSSYDQHDAFNAISMPTHITFTYNERSHQDSLKKICITSNFTENERIFMCAPPGQHSITDEHLGKRLCLTEDKICDGNIDCYLGFDELPGVCSLKCKDSEYPCGNGQCIPINKVMNGVSDCMNKLDEHPFKIISEYKECINLSYSEQYDCKIHEREHHCSMLTKYLNNRRLIDTSYQLGLTFPIFITAIISGTALLGLSYVIYHTKQNTFPNIKIEKLGKLSNIFKSETINLFIPKKNNLF